MDISNPQSLLESVINRQPERVLSLVQGGFCEIAEQYQAIEKRIGCLEKKSINNKTQHIIYAQKIDALEIKFTGKIYRIRSFFGDTPDPKGEEELAALIESQDTLTKVIEKTDRRLDTKKKQIVGFTEQAGFYIKPTEQFTKLLDPILKKIKSFEAHCLGDDPQSAHDILTETKDAVKNIKGIDAAYFSDIIVNSYTRLINKWINISEAKINEVKASPDDLYRAHNHLQEASGIIKEAGDYDLNIAHITAALSKTCISLINKGIESAGIRIKKDDLYRAHNFVALSIHYLQQDREIIKEAGDYDLNIADITAALSETYTSLISKCIGRIATNIINHNIYNEGDSLHEVCRFVDEAESNNLNINPCIKEGIERLYDPFFSKIFSEQKSIDDSKMLILIDYITLAKHAGIDTEKMEEKARSQKTYFFPEGQDCSIEEMETNISTVYNNLREPNRQARWVSTKQPKRREYIDTRSLAYILLGTRSR